MTDRTIAAIDVGSTRLKYALGHASGSLVTSICTRPTGSEQLTETVLEAVGELAHDRRIDAISIVTTGLVDSERGVVESFDTADGSTLEDVPLARAVAERFDRPTYLHNDCNAAAVGEWAYGAGRAVDTLVYLTIATGIGAGIVENGHLLTGEHGQAGEAGLVSLAPFDGRESDGVVGAWEAYSSGRGIPGFARAVLADDDRESRLRGVETLAAADVFAAAEAGDPVAVDVLDRVGRYNAAGLGSLINVVNPGAVTLGGGVALNNPDTVIDLIDRHLEDFLFLERPPIEITALGERLELLGAIAAVGLADSSPYRPN
jgi:glucokinase